MLFEEKPSVLCLLNVGMNVHKETIRIAYLTSNSKEAVKEQQIKHMRFRSKNPSKS
ncbi:hypothetical protein LEP1GSC191_2643 [Leptospira borgpetersenii serovar Mini str. 201000851]|uniref:Uncharacterized protein n=1 Tax=Leptospira borgpetersenii str. 200701203 TaxID=1193007 RepID=M3FBL7_LEPBO|nr:hypothetical protein LEP1GSC123_4852 [Leptospira borgpetersenii str. 200701203]ENO65428.1 hypothetical protein LEP1GSC191_2643 [Leptospira borgpetersenii serovar Mini str. 201000851]